MAVVAEKKMASRNATSPNSHRKKQTRYRNLRHPYLPHRMNRAQTAVSAPSPIPTPMTMLEAREIAEA